MKNWFTTVYAILFIQVALIGFQLLAVELAGVFATKRKMDTISEHWWAFQAANPWPARAILLGWVIFNVWLVLHFAFDHRGGRSGL